MHCVLPKESGRGEPDRTWMTAHPEVDLSYRFAIDITSGWATLRPECARRGRHFYAL
jgi:hypothetical protein